MVASVGKRLRKMGRRIKGRHAAAKAGHSLTAFPSDRATPDLTTREAVQRFRSHFMDDKDHGDVISLGLKRNDWSDFYYQALTMPWSGFVFVSVIGYIFLNFVFALAYFPLRGEFNSPHPLELVDLFFFSVQTLSTVGYGLIAPIGRFANTLVSLEVLLGMMINALSTGVVFARFARPRARIIFSNNAVISAENGIPALCIRIANCRRSVLLSLDVEVALSSLKLDAEGHIGRHFEPLPLVQPHVPVLRFAFVLAHVIGSASPLSRFAENPDFEDIDDPEVVVTVTGTDEATGQTLFARKAYSLESILHNHRFTDMIGKDNSGIISVDYARFHGTEAHPPFVGEADRPSE
ncbi:ATP-sensitive potassium transporter [Novosphingobium nitrogenifigens DSM 19370]|uniref:ATP-sensitive potassium transporter n=2 Tax=Novosphingobium nitrogenifigens TaxID=378548 RepID=F1ZDM2_9SPHN|nr:ion channel [Novosphingobium nitrogenifigens]EGD57394.1 ATP-sensitive potassium transporter [Novosphingobium nitrogenifigens DSM 19370]